jgi:small subunit ribosomal protein S11
MSEEQTEVKEAAEAVVSAPAGKKKPEKKVASAAPAVEEKPKVITAASLLDEDAEPIKRIRTKGSKNVPVGIAFVQATFNNTIVSITDPRGNVVAWSSAGHCGFKGSRKSTAFAATTVAREAARGAIGHGMMDVECRIEGPGAGRESAVRALQAAGLTVTQITDTTGVPHNGCRPPKRRRV